MSDASQIKITAKHKKSGNGAQHQCMHCGKKLKGGKGLKMHIRQEHPEHAPPASPPIDPRSKAWDHRNGI